MQYAIFEYEDETHHDNVRTVEIDGEVWFVADDICKVLEYKKTSNAIKKHCKVQGTAKRGIPDKRSIDQTMIIINESNVYRLILRSKMPRAEKFEDWIFSEVLPTIRRTGGYGIPATHTFVRRFNENYDRVDRGYFSVIGELYIRLYGQFEMVGYIIPEKTRKNIELRPDNSVGRLFSDWLTDKHPELAKEWKTYNHRLPNKKEVPARQYKNSVLPYFIEYVETVWIPKRAPEYFKSRAPEALNHLPKLLPGYQPPPKKLSKFNQSLTTALDYNPNRK